jgi:23S rRNA (guanosine2251-2'-O)-methyltransferase
VARHPRRNEGNGPERKGPEGKRPEREGPQRKGQAERPAAGWSPAPHRGGHGAGKHGSASPASDWIWGWHAALAALGNPQRAAPRRVVATAERARELAARLPALPAPEILDAAVITQLAPAGAAHQGIALRAAPIEPLSLEDLADPARGVLVMLDQVTDPQNVGAVFRSAAAFGARGVILQDRHAPAFSGALAKAAAGALDVVPHARVVNLARALDELDGLGWRAVGLAGDAAEPLDRVLDGRPTVLVLGSEGEGLRRLVGEHCDVLARIPMPGGFESLNVAAAAAIALYEAAKPRS